MDSKKKRFLSLSVLIVGIIMLVVGVVFLILNLTRTPKQADGDFLVEVGDWSLEDDSRVTWKFTEIGKGTLTTNNHTNDYDFTWMFKDGKLLIDTDWLYDLQDEYEYELDQDNKKLTLKDDEGEYIFVGAGEESQ